MERHMFRIVIYDPVPNLEVMAKAAAKSNLALANPQDTSVHLQAVDTRHQPNRRTETVERRVTTGKNDMHTSGALVKATSMNRVNAHQ
jgi:hypothetical protein